MSDTEEKQPEAEQTMDSEEQQEAAAEEEQAQANEQVTEQGQEETQPEDGQAEMSQQDGEEQTQGQDNQEPAEEDAGVSGEQTVNEGGEQEEQQENDPETQEQQENDHEAQEQQEHDPDTQETEQVGEIAEQTEAGQETEQTDAQDKEQEPAETQETEEQAATQGGVEAEEPTDAEQEQPQAEAQEQAEEQAETTVQAEEQAEPQAQTEEETETQKQAEEHAEIKDTEGIVQEVQEITKASPEPAMETMGTSTEAVEGEQPEVDPHAPTPVPMVHKFDPDSTATVRFLLLPSGDVSTRRCLLSHTLGDMKEQFAQELKVPANTILLMHDGSGQNDQATLADLGVGPNGTVQLEMQSADPEAPIKAFAPRQEYHMPDVITVRVITETGGVKDIVVEIERTTRKKPFLGGYRHKKTSAEYHHASAQTVQKQRPPTTTQRFCRDTQTTEQKHFVQQTTNDMSTQMTKIGMYISNLEDKMLAPGQYTTADDYKTNLLNRIVVIQKYYRRWLAKRYVEKIKVDKADRQEWEREEEIRKKKEKEDRIRREFERRMNPKSKEDFDLLYHALEKWRQEEKEHLQETLSGAELKAALCQLLDQETQLIASIGRYKLEADDENKKKVIQAFLDKTASPKKWKGPDGKATEMDTVYTMRAQELRDIYSSINMKYLTQDERLDVLLTLKHTVKEHDCKLTKEIIQLIDREADLLMRGVKESNLEGLRKRIATLFLQYIKTPTFNPEAARLLKVPQDPSTLRKNIYFCPSCNQYLPSTEFQLSSNSRTTGKCRSCNKSDNDARVRQDYSHYRYMIRTLRKSEEAFQDDSKIAFLMQENDLRYLVENVWNSQSMLSAWDDLYDLVLVRWDKDEEWSPWNCILLTKEESSAHDKLEELEDAYGKVLIHKVKHKHTLARNYFSRLPGMAEQVRARAESASTQRGPSVQGKAMPMIKT